MPLKKLSVKISFYLAGAIVLAILPSLIRSNYWIGTVNLAIIYSITVLGLNIILGLTGQLNIAQAAFWGIGAYTAALLNTRLGWPFWATFLVSPPIAAVFGILLGIPTLKLSSHYLALATVGFCIIINLVAHNWKEFTGGVDGIPGITPPRLGPLSFSTNATFYYLAIVCLILMTLAQIRIKNSRMGRAFQAIRENELAAELSGVNTFKYKVIAFSLCSAYAGLAGQLFAHGTKYVSADTFDLGMSLLFLAMLLIGGAGSIAGPIIGASLLTFIPEWLRFLQGPWAMTIFGLAIIFIMIFMPTGLVGIASLLRSKLATRFGRQPQAIIEKTTIGGLEASGEEEWK
jgi:branched-chain amino acid transport system permease protein